MAWITPKINWLPSDGIANSDLNRIEGNTQELYNTKLDKEGTAKGSERLGGYARQGQHGTKIWSSIPFIAADGGMEVGKYIDFHDTDDATRDNVGRLECKSDGMLYHWNSSGAYQVYSQGNKPYASDIQTGVFQPNMTFTNYLNLRAYQGYGSSDCKMWFDDTNGKVLNFWNTNTIFVRGDAGRDYRVFHQGQPPTAADCKALALGGGYLDAGAWFGVRGNGYYWLDNGCKIRQATPDYTMVIQARSGSAGSPGWHFYNDNGSYVSLYASGFQQYSDQRLKTEVAAPKMKRTVLSMMDSVESKYYYPKHGEETDVQHGLYAQDLEAAGFVYAVKTNPRADIPEHEGEALTDTKMVDPYALITYLWDAVKELNGIIRTQRETLDTIITCTLESPKA